MSFRVYWVIELIELEPKQANEEVLRVIEFIEWVGLKPKQLK